MVIQIVIFKVLVRALHFFSVFCISVHLTTTELHPVLTSPSMSTFLLPCHLFTSTFPCMILSCVQFLRNIYLNQDVFLFLVTFSSPWVATALAVSTLSSTFSLIVFCVHHKMIETTCKNIFQNKIMKFLSNQNSWNYQQNQYYLEYCISFYLSCLLPPLQMCIRDRYYCSK